MGVEFINKMMQTRTVYQILQDLMNSNRRDWKADFDREMLGLTVLTDYNNKTYRVEEVSYEQNPLSEFETKNGPISYKQYYRNVSTGVEGLAESS